MAFGEKIQGKKLKTRRKTQNSRKKPQYFSIFINISKASYLTSRRLGYQIMNVEGKKKLETEKRKNSKFKPKTPEFGVFCPLHAEKNGHKTSLYYRPLLVRYSPGGPSCCYYLGWEDFVPELRETGLDPAVQRVPVKKKPCSVLLK